MVNGYTKLFGGNVADKTLDAVLRAAAPVRSKDREQGWGVAATNSDPFSGCQVPKELQGLNGIIEASNVALTGLGEISRLVSSLSGLASLAQGSGYPVSRIGKLEKEAQEIVLAIKRESERSTSFGLRPLKDEPFDVICPSVGKSLRSADIHLDERPLGLKAISFESPEELKELCSCVATAQRSLQHLSDAVSEVRREAAKVLLELEVRAENEAASLNMVKDVDDAVALAGDLAKNIMGNPRMARAAVKI